MLGYVIRVCVCVCVCDTLPPQFKVLMEHLDPDEEDEEGEASASANIRNKAINALLGGSGPATGANTRNQPGPETDDDDSEGDERTPGVRREDTHARMHAHTHTLARCLTTACSLMYVK